MTSSRSWSKGTCTLSFDLIKKKKEKEYKTIKAKITAD